ncbi:MAG: ABC transporter substrate-binding protein [Pseudomonadota bacterium]
MLRDSNTDDVLMHIIEPLFSYTENLEVAPLLSSGWQMSDDGRRYDVGLRRGVLFHNEAPLTADIVAWNIQRYLDPETGWICRSLFDGSRGLRLAAVEVTAEDSIRFTLEEPDSSFLHKLANLQCNMGIVHPDSLDADGEWVTPIGTGPFKLDEWRAGEFVEMSRNPEYAPVQSPRDGLAGNRSPQVQTVRWVVVPEPAAARAGLLSGQLDLVTKLQPADLFDLKYASDIRIHRGVSLDWNVLLMQTEGTVLDDIALRRAIAHAVDADTLAEITAGQGSEANPAIIQPTSSFHRSCMKAGHVYDPELARQWLSRSAYAGQPLTLMANKRFPAMFENAIIIQHMLKEAGISTQLEIVEWTTQLDYYARGDFELMSFGYTGRTHPLLSYSVILGSKSDNPMMQWEDPISLAYLADIERGSDDERMVDQLCELHDRMIDQAPLLNLFNAMAIDAHVDSVSGYQTTTFNKPRLWGVAIDAETRTSAR